MIINNNLNALNASRMFNNKQSLIQKSIGKLSSGLRITRTADDAAGLAISEKMRGQIRGLNQASRNAQDAVSLIQTAEGAASKTHALVQRMRELAVQAANDTNTNTDRLEIQKEMTQLSEEVTRIGNDTEFNTIKLLNKTDVNSDDAKAILSYLKKSWLAESEKLVQNTYGLHLSSPVDMKIFLAEDLGSAAALVSAKYSVDNTSPTGITGMGSEMEMHISINASLPLTGQNPGPYPQYVDRVIAHEMTHAIMAQTMNFGELSIWFKEGAAEAVHGADERLKYSIHNNGGDDIGLNRVLSSIGSGTESDWAGGSDDYSAAYVALRYLDKQIKNGGNADGVKAVMSYLSSNVTHNLEDALGDLNSQGTIQFGSTSGWLSAVKSDIQTMSDLTTKAGIQLDSVYDPETDTGSLGGSDAGSGTSYTAETIISDPSDFDAALEVEQPVSSSFNIIWPEDVEMPPLTFQVGANHGQSISLNRANLTASGLNIANINVLNHPGANAAIESLDSAIERVSSFRSEVGALQNRLEHTISHLENSSENLSASESRIRDVDMAREIMNYTKENILMQAAQSMLVQANQQPQMILQLLG